MKKTFNKSFYISSSLVFGALLSLSSCEDVIRLETEKGNNVLVIDGWIDNQARDQKITLSYTTPYFDNTTAPRPALNAEVTVTDGEGKVYRFLDENQDGVYVWNSADSTMGRVGQTYQLTVKVTGAEYSAKARMKRVPSVDSIVYQHRTFPFEPQNGPKKGFIAEFFARDFPGEGDCYRIRALKDGKPYKQIAQNISLAYDAGFSPGSPTDGLVFILPLRRSITIEELFSAQDSVGVELMSIEYNAFRFFQRVREESSNGGLFAVPSSNAPTNIEVKTGKKAIGFFGATAISRLETRIDPAKARPEE